MILKKIFLSCLAISTLIIQENIFCAAPKKSESPLADLAPMIQELDRDDIDMLWANNLQPISRPNNHMYKKQFSDVLKISTPSYIPIEIIYKEFNNQEMPDNIIKIIFPDNTTHILDGHTARVIMDSHHPYRDILATASIDGTIIIWNIKTQKIMTQFKNQILSLRPEQQKLYTLHVIFFSNDGSMLHTMSYDQKGNAKESFYGSPFNILTLDQTILLSMIQKMFKEKNKVSFAQLARLYKKEVSILESIFKTFDPKAQAILKEKYSIQDEVKPKQQNTSAACAIQ